MRYKTAKFIKAYNLKDDDPEVIGIPFTYEAIECMAVRSGKGSYTIYEFYTGLRVHGEIKGKRSIKKTILAIVQELRRPLNYKSVERRRKEVELINTKFSRKTAEYNNKFIWGENKESGCETVFD